MKKVLVVILFFIMNCSLIYTQDTTKIYAYPESPGDYTKYKFTVVNKHFISVKEIRLEILTDGYQFSGANITGDAKANHWYMNDSLYAIEFKGGNSIHSEQTLGEFHFELDGPDGDLIIKWITLDSNGVSLNNGIWKLPYVLKDTCMSFVRETDPSKRVNVTSGSFITGGGFTWETWFSLNQDINSETGNGHKYVIAGLESSGNPKSYLGFGHSGLPKRNLVFSLDGDLQNTIDCYPAAGWVQGKWYHVAVVHRDDGAAELYLDGVLVKSKLFASAGNVPFIIYGIELGAFYDAGTSQCKYFFDGALDEIRFWNIARNPYHINEYKNICLKKVNILPSGLYAYYPITVAERFWPIPLNWGAIIFDQSIAANKHTAPTSEIDWNYGGSDGLICCGGTMPCLCKNDQGANNFSFPPLGNKIAPWKPDLMDDCCQEMIMKVDCDMAFVNMIKLESLFPGVTITGIEGPAGWSASNQTALGWTLSPPDGYLPSGLHNIKMCFDKPVNPDPFSISADLYFYYDDNHYTKYCDNSNIRFECGDDCDCDSITANATNFTPVDPSLSGLCCNRININSICDLKDIDQIHFEIVQPANGLNVNFVNGPATWNQVSSTANTAFYEAAAGDYMAQGDHEFEMCVDFLDPNTKTSDLYIYYHNNKLGRICGDTITIGCGCCSHFKFNITEDTIYQADPPRWHTLVLELEMEPKPDNLTRVFTNIAYIGYKYPNSPTIYGENGAIMKVMLYDGTNWSWYQSDAATFPNLNYQASGWELDGPKGGFMEKMKMLGKEVYWGDIDKSSQYRFTGGPLRLGMEIYVQRDGFLLYQEDSVYVGLRVQLTDTNCCTCDTVIDFKIKREVDSMHVDECDIITHQPQPPFPGQPEKQDFMKTDHSYIFFHVINNRTPWTPPSWSNHLCRLRVTYDPPLNNPNDADIDIYVNDWGMGQWDQANNTISCNPVVPYQNDCWLKVGLPWDTDMGNGNVGWSGTICVEPLHCFYPPYDNCTPYCVQWDATNPSTITTTTITSVPPTNKMKATKISVVASDVIAAKKIKYISVELKNDDMELYGSWCCHATGNADTLRNWDFILNNKKQYFVEFDNPLELDAGMESPGIDLVFEELADDCGNPEVVITLFDENSNPIASSRSELTTTEVSETFINNDDDVYLFKSIPNPTNNSARVYYNLGSPNSITLELFDMNGRFINVYDSGYKDSGIHEATINTSGLISGTYLVRLTTDDGKSGTLIITVEK